MTDGASRSKPLSESSNSVHVAVACDDSYAMPLAAMLASLAALIDPQCMLTIHAVGSGLTPQTWSSLRASTPGRRVRWNCVEARSSTLIAHGFSTRPYEHVSTASLFRLLLPELLPADLERVLYLDSDLIVRRDVSELWRTDVTDVPLAAVTEWNPSACTASSSAGIRRYRELGIPPEQPLFNAGVLLVNLAYWRESQLPQRAFAYIREIGPDLRWHEQEALNVVTGGRYRELEPRWNVPASMAARLPTGQVAIVHYLTANKPWHWHFEPTQSMWFFDALDRTPWAGWRPVRPRFGTARRLRGRLSKAVQKRLHAARRIRSSLGARFAYGRAAPRRRRSGSGGRVRATTRREIRLFMTARNVDLDLIRTLTAYFGAGVERALVSIDSEAREEAPIPDRHAALIHLFRHRAGSAGLALRHLLHRHGSSHWCVLGRVSEVVVDGAGSLVNLGDLCAELDEMHVEALDAASGDGRQIELAARDARSDRVFIGTARVARPAHAYDSPTFLSRVVLLKYGSHVLLDADARLAGNVPKGGRGLRLKRLDRPGAS